MSEYIVEGAEPNNTTLHYRTPNGYEAERWLVVREEIVRCRDCEHYENTGNCHYWASYEPIPGGDEYMEMLAEVTGDGFCAWGEYRNKNT